MKSTIILALCLFVANAYGSVSSTNKLSEAEKEVRRAERRLKKLQKTGGRITDYRSMKGTFCFVNCQQRVPTSQLDDIVEGISQFFSSEFKFIELKHGVTPTTAGEALKETKANAAVFVVALDGFPTLLTAPESRWAMINVTALAADGPDQDRLNERTHRELWRAFGYLTSQDSMAPLCVMHTISSLKELDEMEAQSLSEEPLMKAIECLKRMGITPYRSVTYRTACQEGWAPAPTNDIQKAIWDKVHAIPSKPLKIEYNEKRDKGK